MTRILLLDADGVMVRPAGYREALRATVNYFVDSPLPLEEESLTELERRQITSEWDMAPLVIAAYWDDVLSRQPMSELPGDVNSAARYIRRQRNVDAPVRVTLRPAHWRVRAFSEDGHGLDVRVESTEAGVVEAAGSAAYDRFTRIAVGVGVILGLFGVLKLFIRRRPA